MSEERTNMAIRDLKHYVIDNMSLDVQDDFEIICKYITNLQQKVEQLENIRKEAIEYTKENKNKTIAPYGDDEDTDYEMCLFEDDIENLLNILNKESE